MADGSKSWGLPLLLLAAAGVLLYSVGRRGGGDGVGEQVTLDWKLPRLDEPAAPPGSAAERKVTLVNFWGYWCPPCRAELPVLAKTMSKLKDDSRFRFLPVACEGNPAQEQVDQLRAQSLAFLKEANIALPLYYDPGGALRREIDRVAAFQGYPTTVLLDPDGVIRGLWVGYEPGIENEILARVEGLLK